MINLLSQEHRAQLAAAKRNVILRKYVITLMFLIGGIVACYGVGYFMLDEEKKHYQQQLSIYEPQRNAYADTTKQAQDFSKNLRIAKSILDNEIVYSDLIMTLSENLPSNVVLTNLSLRTKELAQPISITINVKTPNDAVATKTKFQQGIIFKDTKIKTIDKSMSNDYPYTAVIITTLDQKAYLAEQARKNQ
ncbi:MAG: hypothetical protein WAW60_00315 [Candidatus Saccharimonadales bacterium]